MPKVTPDLQYLIEQSKGVEMSAADYEAQRRSFAYGNTNIENDLVTREVIAEQAEKLKESKVAG
ncbi:MAG: hypothetical protein K2Y40_22310 [Reyranella sp.]|jgi:hypothetical protein|nr:hypothetical protein [Reyranella sp.]